MAHTHKVEEEEENNINMRHRFQSPMLLHHLIIPDPAEKNKAFPAGQTLMKFFRRYIDVKTPSSIISKTPSRNV